MDVVEKFGQFVVANLRDEAIDFADGLLAGHWKSPNSQPLQAALRHLSAEQRLLVRRCVVVAVDSGLHSFLFALGEAHDFDRGISVMVDGQNVAEQSDGLHGEAFVDNGWYARFSKHGPAPDIR